MLDRWTMPLTQPPLRWMAERLARSGVQLIR